MTRPEDAGMEGGVVPRPEDGRKDGAGVPAADN